MILVTGGTGLVGAHLLFNIVNKNEQVKAIYRQEESLKNVKQVFSTYTENYQTAFDKIVWVRADILDIPALDKAFEDITMVYHCAAFVSFETSKYHLLRRTNIEGTANIVNLCIDKGIKKLCHVSSISTLGQPTNGETITENVHWNPEGDNSVYGISKYGAEMQVWRGAQEGLNVVIVNPGVILGAGIWHSGTGQLFKKAHRGLSFYTRGTVPLIDVKDVVTIMIQLMERNIENERFILVAENWTYKRFLDSLSRSVKQGPPQILATEFMLNMVWKLDWIKHVLTGKPRKITKHIAKVLQKEKYYSSLKIEKTLDYTFVPIDKTVSVIGLQYLKQAQ
ncbi:NAD-dependent epimerase/dehydratase family protein [Aestuariivivens sediminicola]|uniref:NAD-dependent epimerase/dehydratase family protein n=1 Tax=Aestuariivivens sediminicola TaxID=2913560 RepID=UPI001F57711E|nr:NAD-dependent epimerase/dehydratase family protein [Aestuariivivens sediminicola]